MFNYNTCVHEGTKGPFKVVLGRLATSPSCKKTFSLSKFRDEHFLNFFQTLLDLEIVFSSFANINF